MPSFECSQFFLERSICALDGARANSIAIRRQLMVFRARMSTVEESVTSIGDALQALDESFDAMLEEAAAISQKCRETAALCDEMLRGNT
jgi:exonuclease VII small subunit